MTFKRFLFLIAVVVNFHLFGNGTPEINESDVARIMKEMMNAHACQKKLTPQLIKRALAEYIDELDPIKTYFIKSEIEEWIEPSDTAIQHIQQEVEKGKFTTFETIHSKMLSSIKRRGVLEEEIQSLPLPSVTHVKELQNKVWPEDMQELKERLLTIRALQMKAAEKLGEKSKDKIFLHIGKKRAAREEELAQKETHKPFILANFLKAFAASLDAHTSYFTPREASQFLIQVQQRLFGIGVQLKDDLNGFTIVKIVEEGPASKKGGLLPNDRIIAINDDPVVGLDINDVVELIRGEEGSSVCLTVLRETASGEETHTFEIVRGEVVLKETRIETKLIPFGDGMIAHIALHSFYQDPAHSSAADLQEEILKIKKEHNLKGILLDLRTNSGGLLPQAVAVTGLFITKGIVVSVKDNLGILEHLRDVDGRTVYDGPLVILTSRASASAAEIVAQTLQDYGRAILVGDEHTFGKGTFQTFTLDSGDSHQVNPKGEYKVTRGRYYTVSGKSPQLEGVIPDIIVPGLYSKVEIGEKLAKYPLENDTIKENFQDDLSDIPPIQREQLNWLYRFNLQTKLKTYTRFLPQLRQNSAKRLENPFYQAFLKDTEHFQESEKMDIYSLCDPQLKETLLILQDLIVLLQ